MTSDASGFEARKLPALEEHASLWRTANACVMNPDRSEITEVHEKTVCDRGRDGSEVVVYLLLDGGHTWPGGRVSEVESRGSILGVQSGPGSVGPVSAVDAAPLMLEFFRRYRSPDG